MRIRTQLILASFVLAVIPLAAIVTYSYHSSRRALETADRREAQRMAKQMDRRLASIRADLGERIALASALPVTETDNIAAAMGDATNLVESLEFKPLDPEPHIAEREPEEELEPPSQTDSPQPTLVAMVHAAPHAVPSPPPPHAPILIDLPEAPLIPHFVMSEKQRELLTEVSTLGLKLGDLQLPADEREDIRRELAAAQRKLNAVIAEDLRQVRAQTRRSRQSQRDRQRVIVQTNVAANVEASVDADADVKPEPEPPAPAATPKVASKPKVRIVGPTPAEIARIRLAEKKASLILGHKFKTPVHQEGKVVGQLTPRINPERVIGQILGSTNEDSDEIPFAVDREGNLYARTEENRATLERAGISGRVREGKEVRNVPGWVVSTTTDQQSGLRIGVARPVGETMDELRRTHARNFVLGLGLIAFALIGIVPLSNHLTRDVKLVTEGAERIAHGDLMTRLPVKTDNELGQLARAFNRMAEDLSLHQQKEVQQRVMKAEYERKSVELEDARRFQLSLLPKEVPHHENYRVAVYTRTATEVGGDYYDFHLSPKGTLSVTIGDATGHGAKAGTMVTVIKALFAGYDGDASPADFLRDAAERIKRMELGRMSMALSLARLDGRRLTLASAGMPPVLVHRAARGDVEEISLGATPLGTLGVEYPETTVDLDAGDTVLFLTDGFPELMNDSGQQLGYAAALDAFALAAKGESADEVVASLIEFVRTWHGDGPPNDDVTFVVAKVV